MNHTTETSVLTGTRPDPAAARARLIDIVREKSFQNGPEMKLASGRTSTFYFGILAQTHQEFY